MFISSDYRAEDLGLVQNESVFSAIDKSFMKLRE